MIPATHATPPLITAGGESAGALALRLAHAENALLALASGQIDAIIDPEGRAYLLRPAQEHLRQNERRLQAVIDSVPDVIAVVNRGGAILSLSHAARKVLGCEPEELTGESIFEHIHPGDFPAVYAAFFNVIEGIRENAGLQFRHRAGDGSYRIIHASVAVLRDVSPATVVFSLRPGVHRIFQPVEAVRPETDGSRAQLAKDRFLAMLAHELRTPLVPALLGLEELQQDERFAKAEVTLTMIRRNLETEARLVAELFDFTSVGQRKIRLQSQSLDAHEAIRLALETCRPEITAAEIQVLLDLRASEPLVLADSMKLQQVMWNLLKNAIKFSPQRGTISVSTSNASSDRLAIEFADHGIGIEPELLPFVFDSFWQGDPAKHQIRGGLGLGLFIARGLAEAHGGTLTALSQGRGQGASFCLTLLKAPPDGVVPTHADPSPEN